MLSHAHFVIFPPAPEGSSWIICVIPAHSHVVLALITNPAQGAQEFQFQSN